MSFAFGNPAVSSAAPFGSTNTFGFGQRASVPTAGTSTGFNFGAPTATTSASGFAFGAPTATTSSGFAFGAPAHTTSASGFAFGAQPSTFGFGNTSTAPTSSAPFAFGSNPFGATAATASQPFSFGNVPGAITTTAPSTGFSFGQPTGFGVGFNTGIGAAPTQPQTNLAAKPVLDNNLANLVTSVTSPMIFGDERDTLLIKWNQLQALWGTGKGYFTSTAPPVDFTPDNPYCRFKAVGYSMMPSAKPEDCFVTVLFNKKIDEVNLQKQQIIESLHRCLGSKPNIAVNVESLNPFLDDKSEMVIYVLEKNAAGGIARVSSNEICVYVEQVTVKPQLAPLGIISVFPTSGLSKDQLHHYLDNPPNGIDPALWQQAKADNPNPEKLVPVALIGFPALQQRLKSQELQIKVQKGRLNIISDDLTEMQRRQTNTSSSIAKNKRKLLELQHKILKMLVQQEITRKIGFSIQADEEELRVKLEAIQAELSAPTQFKGHLRELISQIRLQNYKASGAEGERYMMDEVSREQVREHLRMQQEGITHLINIIKEDVLDLKTIENVSKENVDKKR